MATAKKVLVLTRNYSTGLSIVRSLGYAGYEVDLIASAYKSGANAIASKSRFVKYYEEVVSQKVVDSDDAPLLEALLRYGSKEGEKVVLFPTDDYTASLMDQKREDLDPYFLMPHIMDAGPGAITKAMQKAMQSAIAAECGILVPRDWEVRLAKTPQLPPDLVYPCFCKPLSSVSGYKKEMAVCDNEDSLKMHLRKLYRKFPDRSVLLQEYLNIENEIDLSGAALDQEIIIPAIIRKRRVAQFEKGVTLSGQICPAEELGDLLPKIKAMMARFRYFGMFDFEINIVGGQYYFNEVNFRSGGPNYSYFGSGVNLPALVVKELYGEKHTPDEERVREYGKVFLYEKVAWEDHIHGFLPKEDLDRLISTADITLLADKEDPAPYAMFRRQMRKTFFRNKIKSVTSRLPFLKKKNVQSGAATSHGALHDIFCRILWFLCGYPYVDLKKRNAQVTAPTVLVVGRNYATNLNIARSVGRGGYRVEVLHIYNTTLARAIVMHFTVPCCDAFSRYVKGFHIVVTGKDDERILEKLRQIADPNHRMLLIPTDDKVAGIADEHYEELHKLYHLQHVNNRQGQLSMLMGKLEQKALARKAGFRVASGCRITVEDGAFEIPSSVRYPCFVKPDMSRKAAKVSMRCCRKRSELERFLKRRKSGFTAIVEDYIEIDRECSVLGFSTRKGDVYAPAFFQAELGGKKEHRGVAITGRILDLDQYPSLKRNIQDLMSTTGYSGLFDIDLIIDTKGRLYFVELNLRYGASGFAFTQVGINLPAMYADYRFRNKKPSPEMKCYASGKTFVSERGLLDAYAAGNITFSEAKRLYSLCDIKMLNAVDDRRPWRHFRCFYPVAVLVKLRKRWSGRRSAGKQKELPEQKPSAPPL